MILFIVILFIAWPIIASAVFVGIAVKKKWWSNDKLSIICGGIGIIAGAYYMVLFNGGFNNLTKGWPIWLICFVISAANRGTFFLLAKQRQTNRGLMV